MTKCSEWGKEKMNYDLSDGYDIEKADWKEFATFFAVYEIYHINIWFRKSFEEGCLVLENCDECYWIRKDGTRIGGVLLEPNYMNCLFLMPPHADYDLIIGKLRNLLLVWSDNSRRIIYGGVKPDKIRYFQRLGFHSGESRRCMIRPTESSDVLWKDGKTLAPVKEESLKQITELFAESFHRSDKDSLEKNRKSVQYFFDNCMDDEIAKEASILIYDNQTGELAGACLISIWEGWPNIYDVAVRPSYQNQGLARNMIRRALSVLKDEYPVLRLFVTLGNDAELLYHKMGFLPGVEWTEMYLPPSIKE